MSFETVFLRSSYALIFLGLGGLFFTEELSLPFLLLAVASFIIGAVGDTRGGKGFFPAAADIALGALLLLTLFSIFIVKAPPLQELVHFLLALQAVKLLAPKKRRDWFQLYLLSFFSLVASSALTVEVSFAVIFVSYVFAAPWVLILFQLRTEMGETRRATSGEAVLLNWSLVRLAGATGLVLLALTLVLFTALPRIGVGLFGGAWASGAAVTGFSDRLTLGEVAQIQKNNSVAMRVNIEPAPPPGASELYWRGVALDLFDGEKWQKSKADLTPLRSLGDSYAVGNRVPDPSSMVRQRIILEPTGSATLFALNRPAAVSGRLPRLFRDPLGDVRAAYPFSFQVSYEVLSHPKAGLEEALPPESFLQLPVIDSRILQIAESETRGIDGDKNKAGALERFLKRSYRYSLEGLPAGEKDPLAAFLFDQRQGNCEYFASALAVMLRSLGIPARVVNGYLGGEWNPYGEYFLIWQSNAHSWVEAHFADDGWVTLDPTPAVPGRAPRTFFGSFSYFVDFLRFHWYRYVINFGLADQRQILMSLKRPHRWFDFNPRGFSLAELGKQASFGNHGWWKALFALGILFLGWRLLTARIRRQARQNDASHFATERYRRLLLFLERKGLRKKAGETADEFSQRAELAGKKLLREFTRLYQEARFSRRGDLAGELKRMDEILVELKR